MTGRDGSLFDPLGRTNHHLDSPGGWLRPVGLDPPVLDAIDQGTLPEVLLAYWASEWASRGVG